MPAIVLYSMEGSPPCRSVLMVLEFLGLDATIKEVNPIAGETFKSEFLEKNHLHTIPLLQDGDFILPDSHAIITYLVSKYGAEQRAVLYPSDLRTRALVDQRLFFDSATLFPRMRAVMTSIIKDKATEVSADQKAQFEEAYGFVEKFLKITDCLTTDHVTLADIACIATMSSMNSLYPIDEKYVKTHKWWNMLKQYGWYQKGNEGLAQFDGFVKSVLK